jgi:leishmanolysin
LDNLQYGTEAYGAATGRLVEVIVHEMIHVLGFGSNHYEDWRGPDGKLYGRKNVIVNKDGRPYMATPKVTKVARDFFGCSSLPGAPLENEGPSFSAVSHFEYRLLQVGVQQQ